jgi:hypothetical protein
MIFSSSDGFAQRCRRHCGRAVRPGWRKLGNYDVSEVLDEVAPYGHLAPRHFMTDRRADEPLSSGRSHSKLRDRR